MNRLVLPAVVLFAFSAWGMAQQGTSAQNSTSKKTAEQTMTGSRTSTSSSKPMQHITGCLEKQHGQYVLREKSGKIANVTSTLDLGSQVGHEVMASGTWQPNTSATAGMPPNGGAKGQAVDNPNQLLEIGHMKILSTTCK